MILSLGKARNGCNEEEDDDCDDDDDDDDGDEVISEMAMMTKTSMRKREIGGVEDDVVEMSRQCEGEGEILPPPLTGQFSSDF